MRRLKVESTQSSSNGLEKEFWDSNVFQTCISTRSPALRRDVQSTSSKLFLANSGGGIPFLPSAIHGWDYISLKYHEPLLLSTLPTGFQNVCDISGRCIAVARIMGKFSEVGVVRRKCTLWSIEAEASGCDYFMPHRDCLRGRSGPPRISFLDDIIFYIYAYSSALDLAYPGSLGIFVEKIVASHYLKLADFLQTVIEKFNSTSLADKT
ncbi:hypothetical protein GQ44DRAFT_792464 [Phaeosphaeriaceae sp. PMI808]|nr:hypothetical protein GQ44DRAFT_792464 [Phaeosphaeriaceae sp. PMI808]